MAYKPLAKERVLFRESREGRVLLITRRDDSPFWLATVLYDDGERYTKSFHDVKQANQWLEYNG